MKLGDYVRTKKGTLQPPQIARIKSMQKDSGYHNLYYIELDHNLIPYYNFHIYADDIDKSSPEIIDLIQVGDYVNGFLIDYIDDERRFLRSERPYRNDSSYYQDLKEKGREYNMCLHFKNKDIKSIVTKEQFESMEYKLGE